MDFLELSVIPEKPQYYHMKTICTGAQGDPQCTQEAEGQEAEGQGEKEREHIRYNLIIPIFMYGVFMIYYFCVDTG